MRFDNGSPWGSTEKVPTALALWLVGLGVQPLFGRPRHSTDNAVVERSHGVLNGWVEPQHCANFADLQARLLEFTRFQRQRYPACQGQSRLEAYPALLSQPRPYDPDHDAKLWSHQAIFDYLASFRFQRKVEVNGRINILSREYSLGTAFRGLTLAIQMDAQQRQWIVYDDYGVELRQIEPKDLTYETVFNMALTSRHKRQT
jgi:hypothetical protein